MEWQPIETAPKDGTKFDVWIDWRGRVTDVVFERGAFREFALDGFDGMSFVALDGVPSHWMPLPSPPKTP